MEIRKSDIKRRIELLDKELSKYDPTMFPPKRRITRLDIAKFECYLMDLGRKLELEGILYSGNIPGV